MLKLNLVHFSQKIWHLATIQMTDIHCKDMRLQLQFVCVCVSSLINTVLYY